jgi:hypothetical protein
VRKDSEVCLTALSIADIMQISVKFASHSLFNMSPILSSGFWATLYSVGER